MANAPITEDFGTGSDGRRSERENVALAGSAFGISRSRSVIVSDLSREGARLDARDLPPPGDDLCLIIGPLDTMANVKWTSPEHCGVQFDDPLSEEMLAKIKHAAEWMSVAGWYR